MGRRAYAGEWTSEDNRARYLRVMMMLRSSRPATITCRGLGVVGLPACESVLKSWFSYLQMLLNLTNGDGGPRRQRH